MKTIKHKINLLKFIDKVNNELWKEIDKYVDNNVLKSDVSIQEHLMLEESKKLQPGYIHVLLFCLYGYFYNTFDKELFKGKFEKRHNGFVLEWNYTHNNKEAFDLVLNKEEYKKLKYFIKTLLKNSFYGFVLFISKIEFYVTTEIGAELDKEQIKQYFDEKWWKRSLDFNG